MPRFSSRYLSQLVSAFCIAAACAAPSTNAAERNYFATQYRLNAPHAAPGLKELEAARTAAETPAVRYVPGWRLQNRPFAKLIETAEHFEQGFLRDLLGIVGAAAHQPTVMENLGSEVFYKALESARLARQQSLGERSFIPGVHKRIVAPGS